MQNNNKRGAATLNARALALSRGGVGGEDGGEKGADC